MLIFSCATPGEHYASVRDSVLSLDKTFFADKITVKNDALETIVTVTSNKGRVAKYNLGEGSLKNHLRAFISKKTGDIRCQVYSICRYNDDGWRFYHTANYETPAGPASIPLVQINRDVNCFRSRPKCYYIEDVGFTISYSLLQSISSLYQAGGNDFWYYKLKSKSGRDMMFVFTLAEISAFIDTVRTVADKYAPRKSGPKIEPQKQKI